MSGFDLADRLSFVSGGASGIGRALAEAIVARGGRVVIGDIDADRAQEAAGAIGERATAYACDVRDHAAVVTLVHAIERDLGMVDVAFANAGMSLNAPVLSASVAAFDRVLAVNAAGVWNVASAFGARMVARGSGWLCLTGSEHSLGLPHPGSGVYTATKHFVLGLADAIRAELPDGVGISVLCPGLVATDLYDDARYDAVCGDDPGRPFRKALLSHGMDPATVAAKALVGIERGDFVIPTHGHSRSTAERRHRDIAAGFAAHAPLIEDVEKYDVNVLAAAITKQMNVAKAR